MDVAYAIAAGIVVAYALSFYWLLREESAETLWAVLSLCGFSLALRFLYTTDYPAGFDEHEGRLVECYLQQLRVRNPFGVCYHAPVLVNGVFTATLVPWLGFDYWVPRAFPVAGGVLAVAGAFAVARGLGLERTASLAAAAFAGVLPWANFYGRITFGGELYLHQMLLLASLARLVTQRGGVAEILIGGLGLCFLSYDYFGGRSMLPMPIGAAVLARGRWRLHCLAVLALALAGYAPYLYYSGHSSYAWLGFGPFSSETGALLQSGLASDPWPTLAEKARALARAFVEPAGVDAFFTVRAGAVHPPLVLILAAIGLLSGVRRSLFFLGGFAAGMAPVVIGEGGPNSHRMMMAYPFIALSAGAAFPLVPWRRLRAALAAALVLVVLVQSVRIYFSSEFWHPDSRSRFDWEKTDLAFALSARRGTRVVMMEQIDYFSRVRSLADGKLEMLAVENWLPRSGEAVTYAFSQEAAALRPFYDQLFGPERVEPVGRGFLVHLEASDWSWLHEHGWEYSVTVGERGWKGQTPVLAHYGYTFAELPGGKAIHTWRGCWQGYVTELRLRAPDRVAVDLGGARIAEKNLPEGSYIDFSVKSGTEITVTLETERPPFVGLLEVTPAGERIPVWKAVRPGSCPPAA